MDTVELILADAHVQDFSKYVSHVRMLLQPINVVRFFLGTLADVLFHPDPIAIS